MDTLNLPGLWDSKRQDTEVKKSVKLGDNYSQISTYPNSDRDLWNVSAVVQTQDLPTTINLLDQYKGATPFLWRFSAEDTEIPFTCREYRVTSISTNAYSVNAVFQEYRAE